ncbi:MAG: GNAT family N-acetyltransferase [Plectolyngbya sp. WJT66-NPBG17]|jgi:GNAT superfamily N-acetyltransferase|nr:GNAT family N-acetyltransferase [Plectolyngbya sp. WJT66-NPBG17]
MLQLMPDIRLVEPEDAERIALLCEQLGYSVQAEPIYDRIKLRETDSNYMIYVADLPDRPVVGWIQVGIIATLIAGRQAMIQGLVVDENYRDQGIGYLLTRRAEYWAQLKGCNSTLVCSNTLREKAHYFYRKLGYAPVKTQAVFRKLLSDFDCR